MRRATAQLWEVLLLAIGETDGMSDSPIKLTFCAMVLSDMGVRGFARVDALGFLKTAAQRLKEYACYERERDRERREFEEKFRRGAR